MIPASHNPNVAPPPGKFPRWTPITYTQTFQGKAFPMSAIYVQPSRMRPGFSVVLVGPGQVRATVPDQDLTAAPETQVSDLKSQVSK